MATRTRVVNRVGTSHTAGSSSSAKMFSENSTVVTGDDLQPTKSGVRTGYHGIHSQISQIPGLSQTVDSASEEKARGRRTGVLESDTDYVKLAKQGGHKGLLSHEEAFMSKPNSYQPPNWFCTESDSNSKPSLNNSGEKDNTGAFQRPEPPFGTDNMSTWERGIDSNGEEENNQGKLQSSNPSSQAGKFKKIIIDKKPAPVDMSKLLSFGYVEDSKPRANT